MIPVFSPGSLGYRALLNEARCARRRVLLARLSWVVLAGFVAWQLFWEPWGGVR